jgi:glycosyltransferase involved in cell wall biosynthesis
VACPPGPLADAVSALETPVTPLPEVSGSLELHPRHTPETVLRLARAGFIAGWRSRRLRVDVLHANTIRAGLASAVARPLAAGSIVVHVRDCLPDSAAANLTRRVVTRTAKLLVANSAYTARSFVGSNGAVPTRVVFSPVDLRIFDPGRVDLARARAGLGLAEGTAAIGVVAQLTPWKGQDTAVRAVAALAARGWDVRLFLVGEAKFVSRATRFDNHAYVRGLRTLVDELRAGDRVEFLGERDDVPEIMRALDVVLVPSWEEPFGRTVVEAMAIGTPVIATSVGGPAEVVEEGRNGLLAHPRRPEEWIEALEALLSRRELRQRLGQEGRRTAAGMGREAHASAMLAVWQEAMGLRSNICR